MTEICTLDGQDIAQHQGFNMQVYTIGPNVIMRNYMMNLLNCEWKGDVVICFRNN
jgi:hypothetical protein